MKKVELTKEEKQQAKMAAVRIMTIMDVIVYKKFGEQLFVHYDEEGEIKYGLIGGAYEEIRHAIKEEIEGTLEYLKLLENIG